MEDSRPPDIETIAVCKVYDTFDELGSMAVVLGAIIQVENQRVDLVSFFELYPKGFKGIDNKVCRDLVL